MKRPVYDREQRHAKQESRAEQGWSKRSPLVRVGTDRRGNGRAVASPALRYLRHDGSTPAQRAKRTKHRDSPWIPV